MVCAPVMVGSWAIPLEELSPEELLARLPPMRDRDWRKRRQQATLGCAVVLSIVTGCLVATHLGVYLMQGSAAAWWLAPSLVAAVYAAALLAFGALIGLLLVDPGEVRRSPGTALPLPTEVLEKLRAGESLATLTENIKEGGRIYCVRCLVWRDGGGRPKGSLAERVCDLRMCTQGRTEHHCSICQRCVINFDHHCSVFGRCIAGRGLGGTMGYFKLLLGAGYVGGLFGPGALAAGLWQTEWGYMLVVGIGCYTAAGLCCIVIATLCRTARIWYLRGGLGKRSMQEGHLARPSPWRSEQG